LHLSEKLLGEKHPDTLVSISNLATLYQHQGRYGEAEPLHLRAFYVGKQVLEEEHPSILISANNLATLYYLQGRYEEAESFYSRILLIREQTLGDKHPDTLKSLEALAVLYQSQERYTKAESLLVRALYSREQTLGEKHPDTLASAGHLGVFYYEQEQYAKAELLLHETLNLLKETLGKEHPKALAVLGYLGSSYIRQGLHQKAQSVFADILDTQEFVLGKSHPDTIRTMQNLIFLYISLRQPQKGINLLKQLQNAALDYAAIELSTTLGESQKRRFLTQQSGLPSLALNLAMQFDQLSSQTLASEILLRWTQVREEEAQFIQKLSREAKEGSQIQKLAKKIQQQRSRVSFIINQEETEPSKLESNLNELAELEVQLSKISYEAKQHLEVRNLKLESVHNALPFDSALLAFKVYQPIDIKAGEYKAPHYAVLLLPDSSANDSTLKLIDLGKAEDIIQLGEKLQAGIKISDCEPNAEDQTTAKQLYNRLLGKLDEQLAQYQHIYIAPDHWLHLLNFERLRLPDGRYWIQRQHLHRLSNARDLLRSTPKNDADNLIALGGIDYGALLKPECDCTPDACVTPPVHCPALPTEDATDNLLAASHRSLTRQSDCGFKPLPASAKEAKRVRNFFNILGDNMPTELLLNEQATEASLKNLTQAPRVLHLATHGFYLEKNQWSDRPLASSGLALAHANDGLRGESDPQGEDGILYALEVQDLNLEGTELVALSACETGQGVVDYAEGVYGLIRAFRASGAQHILMSLRKLDDYKAYVFMKDFYNQWLRREFGATHPAEALRRVKLQYIENNKPVDDWAPYVMVEMPLKPTN